jgi:carboxymethylenebutenolidase
MGKMTMLNNVPGYLARPEGNGPFPALLVIQEWWGLDAQTKSIADRFAAEGYLAFAPDVYHGELAGLDDPEKAGALVQKYASSAPDELVNVFDALKANSDCTGKIASVGFCFGGRMSLELGIRRPLDAVCTFYGGGMQALFDELHKLLSPVLGFFGDADVSIPAGTIERFREILERLGIEHEIIVYPNSGHAFFRDSDPRVYKPEASRDAWERTQKFFAKHLK